MSCNKAIFARVVLHETCDTILLKLHILLVVFFNSRQKSRLSYDHNAPNWRWQWFHRRFWISKVSHTFGLKSAPNSDFIWMYYLSPIIWRFSELEIRQFCLFTYPPSGKFASSLKNILFEKLPSTARCSSTHSTYLRRCEWSELVLYGFILYFSNILKNTKEMQPIQNSRLLKNFTFKTTFNQINMKGKVL